MDPQSQKPPKTDAYERSRHWAQTSFEREARNAGYIRIAGVDEAGRGPLAGPVFAAACIIPEGVFIPGIDDSKKLTPKKRGELFSILKQHHLVNYGIGSASPEEIDTINIFQATIQAMLRAVALLFPEPDYLLVDGLRLPHPTIKCQKIIRGDSLSYSIAAASIIAKESRDLLMKEYHSQWPEYGFDRHKGYGTRLHLEAIKQYGPCPIHRRSFAPVATVL